MAQDGFHYLSKLSSRPSESDPDGRLTRPSTSYNQSGQEPHNSLVTGHVTHPATYTRLPRDCGHRKSFTTVSGAVLLDLTQTRLMGKPSDSD